MDNYPNFRGIITTINIPSSVTNIYSEAIGRNITTVNINEGNQTYITYKNGIYKKNEDGTNRKETLVRYYGNESDVEIEEGVKVIGRMAFQNKPIRNVTLPNSLERIEAQAFDGTNITNLELGENLNNISPLLVYSSKINNVTIDSKNENYKIENGILFDKDKTLVSPLKPVGTITAFEIPAGTLKIGENAFHNQYKMTSITIPKGVTEIKNSFNICTSLARIEIPSSVTQIGSSCFTNCPNLTEIIIHKPANSIPGAPWGSIYGAEDRAIQWVGNNN